MTALATLFRATTINQMAVRRNAGTGVLETKKSFRVQIDYSPGIDFNRYQYRQFIKGSGSIEEGSYTRSPEITNWTSAGRPSISVNSAFGVPPSGITPDFREDGAVEGGRTVHYGRQIPGTRAVGTTIPEDRYFTAASDNGCYRATDNVGLTLSGATFSFGGRTIVRSGLRVRINITFQGCIVDTSRSPEEKLQTIHWGVRGDLILP